MSFTTRPVIMGTHGMVTSTHYLSSIEGLKVLQEGGNAVDAGATMWFCLTVLKPNLVGIAGESPILLYWSDEEQVISVNGQGPAPMAASIEWFKERGYPKIPEDGFTPAVVPGAFDAWLSTLEEYGSMNLTRVLKPAINIAKEGFPVYPKLASFLQRVKERFLKEWPTSANIYLPSGEPPRIGQILNNPDWARTFKRVNKAFEDGFKNGRTAGFDSARKYFYDGPISKAIIEYMHSFKCIDVYGKENHGLMTREDMSKYRSSFEDSITVNYRGLDVHKCGPWCQGPVLLQQLNILEGFNLHSMGHNTVEYLHTWIESAKLAFADREQYYADPEFEDVPLKWLLSKKYAKERRSLIDPDIASHLHRPGGVEPVKLEGSSEKTSFEGDTVHLDAVDQNGNMISATPSGGWIRTSPLVPGLGFPTSTRAQMMYLDPKHIEALKPGKRPSTTLTPSLITKEKKPYMVFGTPGGDKQDQWTLQFLLNFVDFEMNVQEALDAPTVHTSHFPGSFWPHQARPGEINVEPRIPRKVVEGLRQKGHKVIISEPWSHGRCLAIRYDYETGVMYGGASPRTGEPYAVGW
jgi:gamma-glutamyltranspeptidase/glutathione hydrolase